MFAPVPSFPPHNDFPIHIAKHYNSFLKQKAKGCPAAMTF
jgi:hypothetical protein